MRRSRSPCARATSGHRAGDTAVATVHLLTAAPIAHQPARRGEVAIVEDSGHCVAERQRGDPFNPGQQECIRANHEPAGSQLRQAREGQLDLRFSAGMQDADLHPADTGRRLQLSRERLVVGTGRVEERGNHGRGRNQLMKELQLLRPQLHGQIGGAREVAARSIEAGDQSKLDRVAPSGKDDRNRRGHRLGR
jgi:hypothetical protein